MKANLRSIKDKRIRDVLCRRIKKHRLVRYHTKTMRDVIAIVIDEAIITAGLIDRELRLERSN